MLFSSFNASIVADGIRDWANSIVMNAFNSFIEIQNCANGNGKIMHD